MDQTNFVRDSDGTSLSRINVQQGLPSCSTTTVKEKLNSQSFMSERQPVHPLLFCTD
jgi:hypothetical protein